MAATVNLKLWKYRPQKDGTYPIYIRITKNRKSSWQATGISVLSKDWDDNKGKVKKSHPNSARLNAFLQKKELKYQDKVITLEDADLGVSIRGIKRKINGEEEKNFVSVANELITRYKVEGKIATHDKVSSIIKKFVAYMGSENFTFHDIDIRTLNNYQQHLIEKYDNKPSSINTNLKFLKTVFLYAQRMEYIPLDVNPFLKYRFLRVQTERGFLTPEEIKAIENLNLENKHNLDKARDIVLFQYYSGGLRISDVLLLKPDNIYNDRVFVTIKKTGKQTSHKLTPKALGIANHYIKMGNEFIFGYLPDGLDLNDLVKVDAEISAKTALINKYLKEIEELCGMGKHISTHIFRHSFATNALQQGMSLDVLQSILNHANIRETQIYAKVLNKKVDSEIDKLNL